MPKSRNRKRKKARTGKKQQLPMRPYTFSDLNATFLMRTPAGRRGIKL